MRHRRPLDRIASRIGSVAQKIAQLPLALLIGALRLYQLVLSPLTGPTCKYYPSCSNYAIVALRTHGALKGLGLALWRVLRCNPWSLGGVDDVPGRMRTAESNLQDRKRIREGALQWPEDGEPIARQPAHVH